MLSDVSVVYKKPLTFHTYHHYHNFSPGPDMEEYTVQITNDGLPDIHHKAVSMLLLCQFGAGGMDRGTFQKAYDNIDNQN